MKIFFILIICQISLLCVAQTEQATKTYNKGIKAFNKKDYKTADSLFTLSNKMKPHKDTYYNLAVTKLNLKDSCGYCSNLIEAGRFGDNSAIKLYRAECMGSIDTVVYPNRMNENVVCYQIATSEKCTSKKSYDYLLKYKDSTNTSCFSLGTKETLNIRNDTLFTSEYVIPNFSYDDEIYAICEEMPEFPGGEQALFNYIQSTLNYPRKASESGISGMVYTTFVIYQDGSIKKVQILRSPSNLLNEEAIRVVSSMPRWTPGRMDGKTVNVQYNLPINFTLTTSPK